jgi:phosphoribosyl-AMP cyclohydrolase
MKNCQITKNQELDLEKNLQNTLNVDALNLNFRHRVKGEDLVIAVAQDHETSEVLMVAFMNRESLQKTLETGKAHYWSTSRQKPWFKGESSGHVQEVMEIFTDCDKDAVLLKVKQTGAACHKGYYSCFFREISPVTSDINRKNRKYKLDIVKEKVFEPEKVYGEK